MHKHVENTMDRSNYQYTKRHRKTEASVYRTTFFSIKNEEYNPSTLRDISTILIRYIKETPEDVRCTEEFVHDICRKLMFLHQLNTDIRKTKGKFRSSNKFIELLALYVQLKSDLFYLKLNPSEDYQKEVESEVARFLQNLLENTTKKDGISTKAALWVLVNVEPEYRSIKNKLVNGIMTKLLEKIDLLNKIKLIQYMPMPSDTLFDDGDVQEVYNKIKTSDYDIDESALSTSEDEEELICYEDSESVGLDEPVGLDESCELLQSVIKQEPTIPQSSVKNSITTIEIFDDNEDDCPYMIYKHPEVHGSEKRKCYSTNVLPGKNDTISKSVEMCKFAKKCDSFNQNSTHAKSSSVSFPKYKQSFFRTDSDLSGNLQVTQGQSKTDNDKIDNVSCNILNDLPSVNVNNEPMVISDDECINKKNERLCEQMDLKEENLEINESKEILRIIDIIDLIEDSDDEVISVDDDVTILTKSNNKTKTTINNKSTFSEDGNKEINEISFETCDTNVYTESAFNTGMITDSVESINSSHNMDSSLIAINNFEEGSQDVINKIKSNDDVLQTVLLSTSKIVIEAENNKKIHSKNVIIAPKIKEKDLNEPVQEIIINEAKIEEITTNLTELVEDLNTSNFNILNANYLDVEDTKLHKKPVLHSTIIGDKPIKITCQTLLFHHEIDLLENQLRSNDNQENPNSLERNAFDCPIINNENVECLVNELPLPDISNENCTSSDTANDCSILERNVFDCPIINNENVERSVNELPLPDISNENCTSSDTANDCSILERNVFDCPIINNENVERSVNELPLPDISNENCTSSDTANDCSILERNVFDCPVINNENVERSVNELPLPDISNENCTSSDTANDCSILERNVFDCPIINNENVERSVNELPLPDISNENCTSSDTANDCSILERNVFDCPIINNENVERSVNELPLPDISNENCTSSDTANDCSILERNVFDYPIINNENVERSVNELPLPDISNENCTSSDTANDCSILERNVFDCPIINNENVERSVNELPLPDISNENCTSSDTANDCSILKRNVFNCPIINNENVKRLVNELPDISNENFTSSDTGNDCSILTINVNYHKITEDTCNNDPQALDILATTAVAQMKKNIEKEPVISYNTRSRSALNRNNGFLGNKTFEYEPHDFNSSGNSYISSQRNEIFATRQLAELNVASNNNHTLSPHHNNLNVVSEDSNEALLYIDDIFNEDTQEDGITILLDRKTQTVDEPVVISIPEEEGEYFPMLQEIEQFEENSKTVKEPSESLNLEVSSLFEEEIGKKCVSALSTENTEKCTEETPSQLITENVDDLEESIQMNGVQICTTVDSSIEQGDEALSIQQFHLKDSEESNNNEIQKNTKDTSILPKQNVKIHLATETLKEKDEHFSEDNISHIESSKTNVNEKIIYNVEFNNKDFEKATTSFKATEGLKEKDEHFSEDNISHIESAKTNMNEKIIDNVEFNNKDFEITTTSFKGSEFIAESNSADFSVPSPLNGNEVNTNEALDFTQVNGSVSCIDNCKSKVLPDVIEKVDESSNDRNSKLYENGKIEEVATIEMCKNLQVGNKKIDLVACNSNHANKVKKVFDSSENTMKKAVPLVRNNSKKRKKRKRKTSIQLYPRVHFVDEELKDSCSSSNDMQKDANIEINNLLNDQHEIFEKDGNNALISALEKIATTENAANPDTSKQTDSHGTYFPEEVITTRKPVDFSAEEKFSASEVTNQNNSIVSSFKDDQFDITNKSSDCGDNRKENSNILESINNEVNEKIPFKTPAERKSYENVMRDLYVRVERMPNYTSMASSKSLEVHKENKNLKCVEYEHKDKAAKTQPEKSIEHSSAKTSVLEKSIKDATTTCTEIDVLKFEIANVNVSTVVSSLPENNKELNSSNKQSEICKHNNDDANDTMNLDHDMMRQPLYEYLELTAVKSQLSIGKDKKINKNEFIDNVVQIENQLEEHSENICQQNFVTLSKNKSQNVIDNTVSKQCKETEININEDVCEASTETQDLSSNFKSWQEICVLNEEEKQVDVDQQFLIKPLVINDESISKKETIDGLKSKNLILEKFEVNLTESTSELKEIVNINDPLKMNKCEELRSENFEELPLEKEEICNKIVKVKEHSEKAWEANEANVNVMDYVSSNKELKNIENASASFKEPENISLDFGITANERNSEDVNDNNNSEVRQETDTSSSFQSNIVLSCQASDIIEPVNDKIELQDKKCVSSEQNDKMDDATVSQFINQASNVESQLNESANLNATVEGNKLCSDEGQIFGLDTTVSDKKFENSSDEKIETDRSKKTSKSKPRVSKKSKVSVHSKTNVPSHELCMKDNKGNEQVKTDVENVSSFQNLLSNKSEPPVISDCQNCDSESDTKKNTSDEQDKVANIKAISKSRSRSSNKNKFINVGGYCRKSNSMLNVEKSKGKKVKLNYMKSFMKSKSQLLNKSIITTGNSLSSTDKLNIEKDIYDESVPEGNSKSVLQSNNQSCAKNTLSESSEVNNKIDNVAITSNCRSRASRQTKIKETSSSSTSERKTSSTTINTKTKIDKIISIEQDNIKVAADKVKISATHENKNSSSPSNETKFTEGELIHSQMKSQMVEKDELKRKSKNRSSSRSRSKSSDAVKIDIKSEKADNFSKSTKQSSVNKNSDEKKNELSQTNHVKKSLRSNSRSSGGYITSHGKRISNENIVVTRKDIANESTKIKEDTIKSTKFSSKNKTSTLSIQPMEETKCSEPVLLEKVKSSSKSNSKASNKTINSSSTELESDKLLLSENQLQFKSQNKKKQGQEIEKSKNSKVKITSKVVKTDIPVNISELNLKVHINNSLEKIISKSKKIKQKLEINNAEELLTNQIVAHNSVVEYQDLILTEKGESEMQIKNKDEFDVGNKESLNIVNERKLSDAHDIKAMSKEIKSVDESENENRNLLNIIDKTKISDGNDMKALCKEVENVDESKIKNKESSNIINKSKLSDGHDKKEISKEIKNIDESDVKNKGLLNIADGTKISDENNIKTLSKKIENVDEPKIKSKESLSVVNKNKLSDGHDKKEISKEIKNVDESDVKNKELLNIADKTKISDENSMKTLSKKVENVDEPKIKSKESLSVVNKSKLSDGHDKKEISKEIKNVDEAVVTNKDLLNIADKTKISDENNMKTLSKKVENVDEPKIRSKESLSVVNKNKLSDGHDKKAISKEIKNVDKSDVKNKDLLNIADKTKMSDENNMKTLSKKVENVDEAKIKSKESLSVVNKNKLSDGHDKKAISKEIKNVDKSDVKNKDLLNIADKTKISDENNIKTLSKKVENVDESKIKNKESSNIINKSKLSDGHDKKAISKEIKNVDKSDVKNKDLLNIADKTKMSDENNMKTLSKKVENVDEAKIKSKESLSVVNKNKLSDGHDKKAIYKEIKNVDKSDVKNKHLLNIADKTKISDENNIKTLSKKVENVDEAKIKSKESLSVVNKNKLSDGHDKRAISKEIKNVDESDVTNKVLLNIVDKTKISDENNMKTLSKTVENVDEPKIKSKESPSVVNKNKLSDGHNKKVVCKEIKNVDESDNKNKDIFSITDKTKISDQNNTKTLLKEVENVYESKINKSKLSDGHDKKARSKETKNGNKSKISDACAVKAISTEGSNMEFSISEKNSADSVNNLKSESDDNLKFSKIKDAKCSRRNVITRQKRKVNIEELIDGIKEKNAKRIKIYEPSCDYANEVVIDETCDVFETNTISNNLQQELTIVQDSELSTGNMAEMNDSACIVIENVADIPLPPSEPLPLTEEPTNISMHVPNQIFTTEIDKSAVNDTDLKLPLLGDRTENGGLVAETVEVITELPINDTVASNCNIPQIKVSESAFLDEPDVTSPTMTLAPCSISTSVGLYTIPPVTSTVVPAPNDVNLISKSHTIPANLNIINTPVPKSVVTQAVISPTAGIVNNPLPSASDSVEFDGNTDLDPQPSTSFHTTDVNETPEKVVRKCKIEISGNDGFIGGPFLCSDSKSNGESMLTFSDNLTQEANRSLNNSPLGSAQDYLFPEQFNLIDNNLNQESDANIINNESSETDISSNIKQERCEDVNTFLYYMNNRMDDGEFVKLVMTEMSLDNYCELITNENKVKNIVSTSNLYQENIAPEDVYMYNKDKSCSTINTFSSESNVNTVNVDVCNKDKVNTYSDKGNGNTTNDYTFPCVDLDFTEIENLNLTPITSSLPTVTASLCQQTNNSISEKVVVEPVIEYLDQSYHSLPTSSNFGSSKSTTDVTKPAKSIALEKTKLSKKVSKYPTNTASYVKNEKLEEMGFSRRSSFTPVNAPKKKSTLNRTEEEVVKRKVSEKYEGHNLGKSIVKKLNDTPKRNHKQLKDMSDLLSDDLETSEETNEMMVKQEKPLSKKSSNNLRTADFIDKTQIDKYDLVKLRRNNKLKKVEETNEILKLKNEAELIAKQNKTKPVYDDQDSLNSYKSDDLEYMPSKSKKLEKLATQISVRQPSDDGSVDFLEFPLSSYKSDDSEYKPLKSKKLEKPVTPISVKQPRDDGSDDLLEVSPSSYKSDDSEYKALKSKKPEKPATPISVKQPRDDGSGDFELPLSSYKFDDLEYKALRSKKLEKPATPISIKQPRDDGSGDFELPLSSYKFDDLEYKALRMKKLEKPATPISIKQPRDDGSGDFELPLSSYKFDDLEYKALRSKKIEKPATQISVKQPRDDGSDELLQLPKSKRPKLDPKLSEEQKNAEFDRLHQEGNLNPNLYNAKPQQSTKPAMPVCKVPPTIRQSSTQINTINGPHGVMSISNSYHYNPRVNESNRNQCYPQYWSRGSYSEDRNRSSHSSDYSSRNRDPHSVSRSSRNRHPHDGRSRDPHVDLATRGRDLHPDDCGRSRSSHLDNFNRSRSSTSRLSAYGSNRYPPPHFSNKQHSTSFAMDGLSNIKAGNPRKGYSQSTAYLASIDEILNKPSVQFLPEGTDNQRS